MDSRRESIFESIYNFFNPEVVQQQQKFQEFQQSFLDIINQKYKDSYISASIIKMNDRVINSYCEKNQHASSKTIFGVYIGYNNKQSIPSDEMINDFERFLTTNAYTKNDPNYQTYQGAVSEFIRLANINPYENKHPKAALIGAKNYLFIFSEDEARLAIESLRNAPSLQFSKT